MSSQLLLLDRIEFLTVKVETVDTDGLKLDSNFPQLSFDSNSVKFLTRSSIAYPPEEIDNPRHFALRYGLKTEPGDDGAPPPYAIEVEAIGFLRYEGADEFVGEDRFRAVRFSGYQILYGAIREMICNITARGKHGMWQLPARSFGPIAQVRAQEDERERQTRLQEQKALAIEGGASEAGRKVRKGKPSTGKRRAPTKSQVKEKNGE